MNTYNPKNENSDRDQTLRNELGETINNDQLSFNTDDNSYEFDVKSDDPDYDHPDPYNTSAKNGEDAISTYDESNPYAVDEYIPNESLETDVDKLGMHIDSKGSIVDLDPIDEVLGQTPEDERDDLDEEGYPKNDRLK